MRVATIDIGTNTVLLLVAERLSEGALMAVEERATITRLGEGVDRSRRLAPAAIARTLDCLDEYARVIRGLDVDRTGVVGTSAMRDAAGGDEVRAAVRERLGVEPRILSGHEEATLTFRGAIGGLAEMRGTELAVFDIGGGSTEVVLGQRRGRGLAVQYASSFDIGSVRLTERHVRNDPVTSDERDALSRDAGGTFASVPALPADTTPVGIAGTMTTLAAVSLGMTTYDGQRVHGHTMRTEEVREVVMRLASLDLDARRRQAGMEPKRADVIVAGGFVALALLEHWGATSVIISDRGVRWGLAEEMAESGAAS